MMRCYQSDVLDVHTASSSFEFALRVCAGNLLTPTHLISLLLLLLLLLLSFSCQEFSVPSGREQG